MPSSLAKETLPAIGLESPIWLMGIKPLILIDITSPKDGILMKHNYWLCSKCNSKNRLEMEDDNITIPFQRCIKCGKMLESSWDTVSIFSTEEIYRNNENKRLDSDSKSSSTINSAPSFKKNDLDVKEVNRMISELREKERAIEILVKEKTKGFPWLAKAWADYLALLDTKNEKNLLTKKNPALKAADIISEIKHEKRLFNKENRILKYTIDYYESMFPWLREFREEGIEDILLEIDEEQMVINENVDPSRNYLSDGEYKNLSVSQKNQLALDRYMKKRKNRWQIGKHYERFIGYLYEVKGYSVSYKGILDGYEDLGRDLICQNGNIVDVVQCKCWSQHKVIRENTINQLFGTTVKYWMERNHGKDFAHFLDDYDANKINAVLMTTTKPSDTAKDFAKALGVLIEQIPLEEYPVIKCNVASDGEKIYHLPFDQQYDRVQLVKEKECYVNTIKEAELLGFRRAFRWQGNKQRIDID